MPLGMFPRPVMFPDRLDMGTLSPPWNSLCTEDVSRHTAGELVNSHSQTGLDSVSHFDVPSFALKTPLSGLLMPSPHHLDRLPLAG